jgi:hypothetical protein
MRVRTSLLFAGLVGFVIYGVAAPRSTSFSSILPASDESSPRPRDLPVDFYGNVVSSAVARYKVDLAGEWFEEHSPETEVPKLPPPKG